MKLILQNNGLPPIKNHVCPAEQRFRRFAVSEFRRPDVEIAYVSFPITYHKEDKDSQQKIDQFVGRSEAVQKSCRNLSASRKYGKPQT